ncbi:hypothetical protein [Legionella sp. WA2022007384]
MFFKSEKKLTAPFKVILAKYDTNPVNCNIASSYDDELHTPNVLTKYLHQEIKFLQSILEANKGMLTKESPCYKEVVDSLRFAEYDLERVSNNCNVIKSKLKKDKKNENLNSELKASKKALEKCKSRFYRMEACNNLLNSIKEGELDKTICKTLKTNITYIKNIINEINYLTKKADVIYQKYREFWGENNEDFEKKLASSKHFIEKKDLEKFDKIVIALETLFHTLPKQYQFLDEFLENCEKISARMHPH